MTKEMTTIMKTMPLPVVKGLMVAEINSSDHPELRFNHKEMTTIMKTMPFPVLKALLVTKIHSSDHPELCFNHYEYLFSKFQLWPVGQGLFYSGNIKLECKFNFVYDCGGNSININSVVDDYINQQHSKDIILDMLVISHFDDDHVNGIPKLLKEVSKVRKVFLPYNDDNKNYLLFLALVYGNGIDMEKKVDEIILVNTKHMDNDEEQTYEFNNIKTSELEDEDLYLPNTKTGILNGSTIFVENKWKFKFYNTYLKQTESSANIKKEIINLIHKVGGKNLGDLLLKLDGTLQSKSIKESLKKIYNKYCSSSYGNSKQNQSSLCLYHSPVEKYNDIYIIKSEDNSKIFFKQHFSFERITGTLLTGDISLKQSKRYNDFKRYYKDECKDVLCFLIPHHGSKNNWNKNVLIDFPCANIFLNSSGTSNPYKHPSNEVITDLNKIGNSLLRCNERKSITYYI